MPTNLPRIYWDSCVPLSYINGYPDRVIHIAPLLQGSGGDYQLITSVLAVVEVAYAATEQSKNILDAHTLTKIESLWRPGSPILLVEFYQLIGESARALMRDAILKGWSLRPADAIHLATADRLGVKEFHTYDHRLDKFRAITQTQFPICRPIASNPTLALSNPQPVLPSEVESSTPAVDISTGRKFKEI
jgi:predicted nucleic acid-binding protein